ncbi:MAG: carbonic anhydrase [Desulfomonile tiedjei]|uniref:Carbonic anhydrase n=1 Tax=Desulfomonile tiedjei TaxID=2358 RepID=A0A9D6Z4K9_9BACT|nr:carbonic anhydrase [Desulfomonile tiedjei]
MTKTAMSANEALKMLRDGNVRFVEGRSESPHRDHDRRILTSTEGQSPFAAVLACSDSRVPIAAIFDRGVGDIFTIRVAGNVVGEVGTGSIEYAVQYLGIRLLVVLGHSSCGAIQAALSEGNHSPSISKLIEKIAPAVRKTVEGNAGLTGVELSDEVARNNVWHQVEGLFNNNEIVRAAVECGRLILMAAFYNLGTGQVEWMGSHPPGGALINRGLQSESMEQTTTGA